MFISVDFARAGGADDRHELPRINREIDTVQHLDRQLAGAVRLRDRCQLDERCGRVHTRGPISGRLPVAGFAAVAGVAVRCPITICSPGSSPETIWAETRLTTPTRTSRDAMLPSDATTRTTAGPLARLVRGSTAAEASVPRVPRRGALDVPAGRSALSGTSTAPFASAATKNTCAVIWVISAPSWLSTSKSASYSTTLFTVSGVGLICRSVPYQRLAASPSVVKYTGMPARSFATSASDTCDCTVIV